LETAKTLPHGIKLREAIGPGPTLSQDQWRQQIAEFVQAGWQLDSIEFRHNRFDTDENGQPRQKSFLFRCALTNSGQQQRAMIEGDLVVDWGDQNDQMTNSRRLKRIDASRP